MSTPSQPAEAQGSRRLKAWVLPQVELKERSDTILGLIDKGLLNDDVPSIQQAGKSLEEFSVFAAQQGLYTAMTQELVSIGESIAYHKTIEAIQNGKISGAALVALFQFIAPPADVVSSCINYAPAVVPAALEAQIKSGCIGSYDVGELTYDLFNLEDCSAFVLMLEYMLHLERIGGSQYFSLPYVISEYFKDNSWASFAQAGVVAEFLMRELADIQYYAQREEYGSRKGGTHLFSLDVLELLAQKGHATAAHKMASFHLGVAEETPGKDVRRLSRLSHLGHGITLKEQLLESIEGLNTLTVAECNLCFECDELTAQELWEKKDIIHFKAKEMLEGLAAGLRTSFGLDPKENQRFEKAAVIFDLVIEHLRECYFAGIRDFVDGLNAVFAEYDHLGHVGQSLVCNKAQQMIECSTKRLDHAPRERQALEHLLLSMKDFPQELWESIEWMKAARLETDLGL